MSFLSIVRVEFIKLLRKRMSLLLLIFFVPAVLFGIGMALGMSFFIADGGGGGVNAVEKSLSGISFAVNMMEQSKYIIFLVVIVLASFTLSAELENGQIKSEMIRICSRGKILAAKYVSLFLLISGTMLLSFLWSLFIYLVLVKRTEYASGWLMDEMVQEQMGYLVFTLLGIGTVLAVTFLLGVKLKTFPCFAFSYIIWFASLYTDFMGRIKLLVPCNMPNYLLENPGAVDNQWAYAALYMGYCLVVLLLSGIVLQAEDIRN